jgi:hypothetical protein
MWPFHFLLFTFYGFSHLDLRDPFSLLLYIAVGGGELFLCLLSYSMLYCTLALASAELHLNFACCKIWFFLRAKVVMAHVKHTVALRDGAPVQEVEGATVEKALGARVLVRVGRSGDHNQCM